MKRKVLSALVAGACTAVMMTTSSTATSLQRLEFDQIVTQADACVIGKAIGSTVEKINGNVYTVTTFQVVNAAFGDVGSTVQVRAPGGNYSLNGKFPVAEVVAGSATLFNAGNQMLFLEESSGGAHNLVGFTQGAFSVFGEGENALVALPTGPTGVDDAVSNIRELRAN